MLIQFCAAHVIDKIKAASPDFQGICNFCEIRNFNELAGAANECVCVGGHLRISLADNPTLRQAETPVNHYARFVRLFALARPRLA